MAESRGTFTRRTFGGVFAMPSYEPGRDATVTVMDVWDQNRWLCQRFLGVPVGLREVLRQKLIKRRLGVPVTLQGPLQLSVYAYCDGDVAHQLCSGRGGSPPMCWRFCGMDMGVHLGWGFEFGHSRM